MGASTTLLMLGSSFGFALCGTCTKAAGRRISTHEKLFLRSILILCFLLVEHGVTGIKGTIARVPPRHRLLLLMRGTAGFIALTAYFEGSMLMPLSTMTVTTRIHPVLSTIGGAIFLGEKAPSSTWISLLLALVGVAVVNLEEVIAMVSDASAPPLGLLLAALAAVMTSAHLKRRYPPSANNAAALLLVRYASVLGVEPLAIILAFHSVSGILSFCVGGGHHFVMPGAREWAWILGTAVSMQLAQACTVALLRQRAMHQAAPSSFLTISWNVLLSAVVLGEDLPTARALCGCCLILGSVGVQEICERWKNLHLDGKLRVE